MVSPTTIANDLRTVLPSAKAAWLYGSVAKNQAGNSSDIDLAVLFDASHTPDAWALSQQASQLSNLWGKPVDLIDMRHAPCVLQKEIIQAQHRLFAEQSVQTDEYELFALSQYREFNERYAAEFERIVKSGVVMQPSHEKRKHSERHHG